MQLVANLDCEARWAGVTLPAAVRARISLYATLFAACAPDDRAHEVWVPAEVDAGRLLAHPGWTPPVVRVGAPESAELRWAQPGAREANDRARTLAMAEAIGVALPGARLVASLAELDAHLASRPPGAWVCKARWTAAGRDRAHGDGARVEGELRRRLERMLARLGPLVFEPWLDRRADFGTCGELRPDGAVELHAPHTLRSDARGGFLGIELSPPDDPAVTEALLTTARAAAEQLAATGYRGPFAIDAFTYAEPDGRTRIHPLCELNARYSFGWIARGLARRLGVRRLGFDPAPAGARVLIVPGPDRVTAWCA
ncbi:MAG TPA: hypothetical protein VGC42_27060 [Kofleriaceae bacterium]